MHDSNAGLFEHAPLVVEEPVSVASLRTLSLIFPNIQLWPSLIPAWRGAVNESAQLFLGDYDGLDIFHNHAPEGENTLHRPALIHYRSKNNVAMLWGMNQGAVSLLQWISSTNGEVEMGGKTCLLNPVEIYNQKTELALTQGWRYYRIHDYIALNPENYNKWLQEKRLIARAKILEQALTAHLLAFCQAANWWLPERLEVDLVEIHKYKRTRYHNTNLLAFEITYRCNLQLPDEIALGKAVSHGFGVQRKAPMF